MSRLIKGTYLPTFPTREDKEDWFLRPMGGRMGHFMPMHLFSQYGEKLVSNTTVETSLKGDAVGSETLPANFFSYQGKVVQTMGMGYWTKEATSDLALRIRLTNDGEHPVTFQNAGDTVTRPDHNHTTSTEITFKEITGGAPLVINTTYFVVTPTPHTFQLALTKNGTPIVLTSDGTGMMSKHSTIIHQKLFTNTRLGSKVGNGGHWEITTMTTAMTLGAKGTINMHGMLRLLENDSAEILGLHSENFILTLDTREPIRVEMTAQWSAASPLVKITSTNYMIM